jgi:beta-galactosidase
MQKLGIHYVRIGEFAWSQLEPRPDKFNWRWLDEILEILGNVGLKVVLATPTAAPPKWLVDRYPEILPVDEQGMVRKFGSRRHYCFSSSVYREETRCIVTLLAERYGKHPVIAGWQVDNEYGSHSTTRCYCSRCRIAFQDWLERKYKTISTLNRAWGTVFWSQKYGSFKEIELPNLTVAEPNPAHLLDYFRFASDQVREYNRIQTEILRKLSPGRFITHNFMGFFTEFDHFSIAQDLDLASWDSYPIGFTEVLQLTKAGRYARTGHPDIAAFNHDLYREMGKGRFWVMEQQPGPVNWAPHNPSPAPGMVRLWTWEAMAHGAEVVSYFRWRQVPFAQEQMHAGLLLPDSTPAIGYHEVKQIAEELAQLVLPSVTQAPVALVFDYEAAWVYAIQPHGQDVNYRELVFRFYTSLRRLGVDVDILSREGPFDGYKLAVVPSLPILRHVNVETFKRIKCPIVFGPRTGSKTPAFQIPVELPPGPLQELIPLRVVRVESVRPDLGEQVTWRGKRYPVERWKEWVETELAPEGIFDDDCGAVLRNDCYYYLAFWPNEEFLVDFLDHLGREVGLTPVRLPAGVRLRKRGELTFAFNFTGTVKQVPVPLATEFLLGEADIVPYGISVWRSDAREK